jgi:hypothetical protein
LTFTQSFDRPARYGRSTRFDTMPSSPMLQAARNSVARLCEKNVSEMRSPNPGRTKKAPNKGTSVGAAQPPWQRPVSRLWGDTWGSGVVNLSPAPVVSTLVKRSQPQANSAAPASVNRTSISHAGSVSPWRIAQSGPAVKTNGLLLLLPLHVAAKTLGPPLCY